MRIAQMYEQELVAQRISTSDIEFISATMVPVLKKLMAAASDQSDTDAESMQEVIDLVQPLLSAETVTVLQLIGFNFRRAIGEPLTEVVSRLILSRTQADPTVAQDIQRLQLERETGYQGIAQDPDAYARLRQLYESA